MHGLALMRLKTRLDRLRYNARHYARWCALTVPEWRQRIPRINQALTEDEIKAPTRSAIAEKKLKVQKYLAYSTELGCVAPANGDKTPEAAPAIAAVPDRVDRNATVCIFCDLTSPRRSRSKKTP